MFPELEQREGFSAYLPSLMLMLLFQKEELFWSSLELSIVQIVFNIAVMCILNNLWSCWDTCDEWEMFIHLDFVIFIHRGSSFPSHWTQAVFVPIHSFAFFLNMPEAASVTISRTSETTTRLFIPVLFIFAFAKISKLFSKITQLTARGKNGWEKWIF